MWLAKSSKQYLSMTHLPVLFEEALQALAIKTNGVYVDCTFGRGGHSQGILARLGPEGRLLALERDGDAISSDSARTLLKDGRFTLKQDCFSGLEQLAIDEGVTGNVDGILIDLGVSSPQLDDPSRGFSFMREGPLDMRMDTQTGISAAQWLAEVDEPGLVKVLFEYGEERFAKRIARAIVKSRLDTPIRTTKQLVGLIENALPVKDRHKHAATRTFQAIRIAINNELNELKQALQQSVRLLKPQGRLVVIAFHSLEDRIVKRFIRAESGAKYDPGKLPVKEADIGKGVFRRIGKVIRPGEQEIAENPRARSAIMRVAERV